MMKDLMEYKGYFGTVHYNDDDGVFYGELAFIPSLVSYEGTDVDSLKSAFHEAVDDYLELCRQTGKAPEKPFSGKLEVRVESDLHRKIALMAQEKGLALDHVITDALSQYITTH